MSDSTTATKLLDAAQRQVQQRGYNAFSYKDLAEEIGIRTASVHYHFRAKEDLGAALMHRYQTELERTLDALDRSSRTNKAKLRSFLGVYRETESCGAMCLCGSLAADFETLGETVRDAVTHYLERTESWIADRIAAGVRAGEFAFDGKPADAAAAWLASLQGGLILARARPGRRLLDRIQRELFRGIGAG